MNFPYELVGERAVLEIFRSRDRVGDDAALPLRVLQQDWRGCGLRAADLGATLSGLIESHLLTVRTTDGGPELRLTRIGCREARDCNGRSRSLGENWIAEIALATLRRRPVATAPVMAERRAG